MSDQDQGDPPAGEPGSSSPDNRFDILPPKLMSLVKDPVLWVALIALVAGIVFPAQRSPSFLFCIGLVLFDLLVIRFPNRQIARNEFDSQQDYIAALNDTRKTWAQILGGIGAVLALAFTWTQLVATQEQQVTDRYAKAVELLATSREGGGRSGRHLLPEGRAGVRFVAGRDAAQCKLQRRRGDGNGVRGRGSDRGGLRRGPELAPRAA